MLNPLRFGGSRGVMNARGDGRSYTIQVKDTSTFELVKRVLSEHGGSAWVSIDRDSGPQWVPLKRL